MVICRSRYTIALAKITAFVSIIRARLAIQVIVLVYIHKASWTCAWPWGGVNGSIGIDAAHAFVSAIVLSCPTC